MRAKYYGAWLEAVKGDDFLGVQNYERSVWTSTGKLRPPKDARNNAMGAEVYPPSRAGAVRYAHAAAGLPIIVTEHGVGTDDDTLRSWLIPAALANLLRTAVIAVGTRDALRAISTDPQVVSRFEPLELPRWTENDGFRAFILALTRELPLRKASSLTDRTCTQLLLRRSDGITGRVCWIIGQAAEEAIRSGTEQIDAALLERVSQRLHLTPA